MRGARRGEDALRENSQEAQKEKESSERATSLFAGSTRDWQKRTKSVEGTLELATRRLVIQLPASQDLPYRETASVYTAH